MDCSKQNITYKKIDFNGKPLFIFINHRVSIICWNRIKVLSGKCDIITFDSHKDFRNGFIFKFDPDIKTFGSKYHKYSHPHFTLCEEFINWDLSNKEQNTKFMKEGKNYLGLLNDNFIDVAFMKDIIKNVFWYYLSTENDDYKSMCEDILGKDHHYLPNRIDKFYMPNDKFILDIDLDFFVNNPALRDCTIISPNQIKKNLSLIKKIINNQNCFGITIALEPGCCGGEENCLKILRELSNKIGIDLNKEIESFL